MNIYKPKIGKKFSLDTVDPGNTGSIDSEEEVTQKMQEDLQELYEKHYLMYAENKRSLLVLLQGIDASGKDGTIRYLAPGFHPIGLKVHSFKAPSEEELDHDYLWRVHQAMPGRGEVAFFNRSHYEEVAVVRVHEEILQAQRLPDEVLKSHVFAKRYRQINDFERMMTENGTIILKFFLHISAEEQQQRLEERLQDPKKNWKYSQQDLKERTFWDHYMTAYNKMLLATHTKHAHWHIIPADKKWYRNFLISRIIVRELRKYDMKFPVVG